MKDLTEKDNLVKVSSDSNPKDIMWTVMTLFQSHDDIVISATFDSKPIAKMILAILEGSHFQIFKEESKEIVLPKTSQDGSIIKTRLPVYMWWVQRKALL